MPNWQQALTLYTLTSPKLTEVWCVYLCYAGLANALVPHPLPASVRWERSEGEVTGREWQRETVGLDFKIHPEWMNFLCPSLLPSALTIPSHRLLVYPCASTIHSQHCSQSYPFKTEVWSCHSSAQTTVMTLHFTQSKTVKRLWWPSSHAMSPYHCTLCPFFHSTLTHWPPCQPHSYHRALATGVPSAFRGLSPRESLGSLPHLL